MACGWWHFEARHRPEAAECWRHLSVSGWPEVCRAHTIACKQVWAKNYSRTKQHYLVKITTISVWARKNLTRGRWFKMAQILMPKRNYNPH